MDLAKIERTYHDLPLEKINLYKEIYILVKRLMAVYKREINLSDENQHIEGLVNKENFTQIMTIFLDNAYKYSQSHIDINILTIEDHVQIQIKDYGSGIPEQDLEKIFTRFYRVDKARSRESGGSGLGLYIAKELALKNHIDIKVDSEMNKGTQFTLILERVK
ncbi:sensor histidine kinase [Mammaliicoccus sciuri]|uniref:sensor histidine kinase n=1 Tax=Mammaliicoccus sciuri TaxID=1296 RepID=UPI0034DDC415